MNCRSCGTTLAENARFCSNCGASQASVEEERRIVTALFADIVGFTALAEHRDPEEVKHVVDRAFAQLTEDITTFGGIIDKIVGDQIVALFGAPVAHSDDAERAVRAGLRMQSTVQSLSPDVGPTVAIRVGINTGEVLVGSTTTGGDYTAMGDVMNSASRLQELADAGQVLVGEPHVKQPEMPFSTSRPAGCRPAAAKIRSKPGSRSKPLALPEPDSARPSCSSAEIRSWHSLRLRPEWPSSCGPHS